MIASTFESNVAEEQHPLKIFRTFGLPKRRNPGSPVSRSSTGWCLSLETLLIRATGCRGMGCRPGHPSHCRAPASRVRATFLMTTTLLGGQTRWSHPGWPPRPPSSVGRGGGMAATPAHAADSHNGARPLCRLDSSLRGRVPDCRVRRTPWLTL
jgi:hypothetical protein